MRPRKELIEIFSTFLQFEADRPQRWAHDRRLNRSMVRSLQAEPHESEIFWQLYWWQRYARGTQALFEDSVNSVDSVDSVDSVGHLSAYLQETCFWSVQRTMPRTTPWTMPRGGSMLLSDCFQVAIADVPRLLQAFDASQLSSLKTYANTVFGNTLRDYLRQRREVDFCSDWGLLLKVSRRLFLETLDAHNFDPATRDRYVLAWRCLKATHAPQKSPKLRTLEAPDQQTWTAIVALYQQSEYQLTITIAEAEKCLLDAARKIRGYLYPTVSSLNLKKGEDDEREWQDDLSTEAEMPMVQLLEQEAQTERQTQTAQMLAMLQTAIGQLDDTSQALLRLYYQEHLTQQLIAQKLDLQQYTVSRRLGKTRAALLQSIVTWGQTTLHISLTSDVIASISALLEEWLESFYESFDDVAESD